MKEGRGVKKESKIAAAITAVIDIVTAGLLWLLCSLPAFFPWVFAFVSRFSNTVSGTLKFCGYLALKNIGVTLLMTAELFGFGVMIYLMPPLVFLLPGLACLLLSLHIEPVFRPLTAEMTSADGDDWFNE